MTPFRRFPLLHVAIFSVLALAVGCQEQTNAAKRHAERARTARPGPEESFELIVETFRRGIEDVPVGFVHHTPEGHSMMSGRSEVSHELFSPTKEGDPYRAIITVGSQSRYSIERSAGGEEEENSDGQQRKRNSLADSEEEADFQVFDRNLVAPTGDTSQNRHSKEAASDQVDKTVTRKVDRQERKYELVYKNGKWKLLTKLDPETEQSIQNAFDRALEMQI